MLVTNWKPFMDSGRVNAPTDSLNKVCYVGDKFEPRHEKTNNVVYEEVPRKLNCTSTEDG